MHAMGPPTNFMGLPPSRLGFVCKPDMPPHINILFRARPPLEYVPQEPQLPSRPYDGIFSQPNILDLFEKEKPQLRPPVEPKSVQKTKTLIEKNEQNKAMNKEKLRNWNPKNIQNATNDASKTLFVYNLSFKTDEKKLKREFEVFGPIKKLRLIRDSENKSRGYAFIEYENKSDFKTALRKADKWKIDDRKIRVDYERGRTDKYWVPRKLGGGKGRTRDYPSWLLREMDELKDKYPELYLKYRKQEEKKHESVSVSPERSKSRHNEAKNKDYISGIYEKIEKMEVLKNDDTLNFDQEEHVVNNNNNHQNGNGIKMDRKPKKERKERSFSPHHKRRRDDVDDVESGEID